MTGARGAAERGSGGSRCASCGAWHDDVPLAFHAHAPQAWTPELAGRSGCRLTDETCVIDDRDRFVRARIPIPIEGHDLHFEWGVWVSLSEASFDLLLDAWDRPGREALPPMFGWLSTELPVYATSTLNLRTMLHAQPVGVRSVLELEQTAHPLAVEQRTGISWGAVAARARMLLE